MEDERRKAMFAKMHKPKSEHLPSMIHASKPMVETIPMYMIERKNMEKGQHFFDADTMRFFSSRKTNEGYLTSDKQHAYFVTSEQFKGDSQFGIKSEPRKFSVRRINMESGDIATVGEFNSIYSLREAKQKAKELSLKGE